jgi:tetratricopeptide (TPR) repeat protein
MLGPDDPQTHYSTAVLYEKTFEPQLLARSLDEYEKAAELAPYNYFAWLELGKARDRGGDGAGAEKAFLRALSLAPNYADVQWALGNSLLRAGRVEEAFVFISKAAHARPEYMRPAVFTAMTMLDNDAARVRGQLGDTGAVNAAIVNQASSGKRYEAALAAWLLIPNEEKRAVYRDIGKALSVELAAAGRYRDAVAVAAGIWEPAETGPAAGSIYNGGFETGIRLRDASLFDWQVGAGGEPQVGLSDSQKRGGSYSLYLIFNSLQAADFRQISQTVAIQPGRTYSFEGYFRADLKGSVAWEVSEAAGGRSLGRSAGIQSSPDWAPFRVVFSAPASVDGIVVRLVRDGCTSSVCPISGKVWFDDFSFEPSGK